MYPNGYVLEMTPPGWRAASEARRKRVSGHYERSAALPQGLHLLAPLAPQSGCVIDETVDEGLEVLNFESDAAPEVDRW